MTTKKGTTKTAAAKKAPAKRRKTTKRTSKKAAPKRGRRSKLTPTLQASIEQHIIDRVPPVVAAQCEGISERTYHTWMARGRRHEDSDEEVPKEDRPFVAFFAAVTRARALAEARALQSVRGSIDKHGNEQHGTWWLERAHPERWGHKVTVELREQALDHVIARLREGLDPTTFQRCMAVLSGERSGEGTRGGEEEQEAPLPLH